MDEDESFKSTSQLLRDDSFKSGAPSPTVTSKLPGSGSFKRKIADGLLKLGSIAPEPQVAPQIDAICTQPLKGGCTFFEKRSSDGKPSWRQPTM